MVRNYKSAKIVYQQKVNAVKDALLKYIEHKNLEYRQIANSGNNEDLVIWESKNAYEGKLIITRQNYKQLIMDTLQITGINTISNWMNLFIANGTLSLNPHTSFKTIIRLVQHEGRHEFATKEKITIYKPTPDTRYIINYDKLNTDRDSALNQNT